jgi:hypothetical protein
MKEAGRDAGFFLRPPRAAPANKKAAPKGRLSRILLY